MIFWVGFALRVVVILVGVHVLLVRLRGVVPPFAPTGPERTGVKAWTRGDIL